MEMTRYVYCTSINEYMYALDNIYNNGGSVYVYDSGGVYQDRCRGARPSNWKEYNVILANTSTKQGRLFPPDSNAPGSTEYLDKWRKLARFNSVTVTYTDGTVRVLDSMSNIDINKYISTPAIRVSFTRKIT